MMMTLLPPPPPLMCCAVLLFYMQVAGKVIESLPNATFRVEIEPSKQVVFATISGKIRKNQVNDYAEDE